MFYFFIRLTMFFLFLEFLHLKSTVNILPFLNGNFFITIFLLLFFIVFLFRKSNHYFNFNSDLFYKYYLVFFNKLSFFVNFFVNTFKRIYLFYRHFKYKFFIDTVKIFARIYLKKINLIWRPLFKKFSYFGYFRSNRSRWLKK